MIFHDCTKMIREGNNFLAIVAMCAQTPGLNQNAYFLTESELAIHSQIKQ